MGTQNQSLPNVQLILYDIKGTVADMQEGRFGHNALWRRQNEMLNQPDADHVRIHRVYRDENAKDTN